VNRSANVRRCASSPVALYVDFTIAAAGWSSYTAGRLHP
jgi:hypothetical protein